MTKILITGTHFQNKGAGAMLISTSNALRTLIKPLEITMLSPNADYDKKYCDKYKINIVDMSYLSNNPVKYIVLPLRFFFNRKLKNKDKVLNAYNNADVILDLNGISFTDAFKFNVNLGLALRLKLAFMLKKSVIMYSQSFGPFKKLSNRILAKYALKKVKLITVRGNASKNYLKQIGIKADYVFPDSAFLLEPIGKDRINQIIKNEKIEQNEKIIGIAVNEYIYKKNKRYVDFLVKLTDYLNSNLDVNILFIPHYVSVKGKDDVFVAKEVYKKCKNKDKIRIIEKNYGPEELKAIIGLCKVFIGSRYHSIVASTSMKVPTIVLGWSHKYVEVMQLFNLEEYVFNYQKVDFNKFKLKFEQLWLNKKKIEKNLKEKIPKIEKLCLKNTKILSRFINKF
ncbi:MAG: polysaccharide pyruvyl transferase family protein [Nanoarchaeota archaeon]|nr:polysaccharide pyruvyl transferase family protein [Nanoarchaeota archaeon]